MRKVHQAYTVDTEIWELIDGEWVNTHTRHNKGDWKLVVSSIGVFSNTEDRLYGDTVETVRYSAFGHPVYVETIKRGGTYKIKRWRTEIE